MKDFEVIHFSPGRLRVRLAQVAQDPEFAAQLEDMLSAIDGIRTVAARSLTGSVLVEYDTERLDPQSLLALGRMLDLVPEDMPGPALSNGQTGAVATGAGLIGDALGTAIERGGQMADQVLNPRFAVPAVALSAVARGLGIRAAFSVSPGLAAAWIVASVLVRRSRSSASGTAGSEPAVEQVVPPDRHPG